MEMDFCVNEKLKRSTKISRPDIKIKFSHIDFSKRNENFDIFRPYSIWEKKIFKSNAFFTKFAKHQIYI